MSKQRTAEARYAVHQFPLVHAEFLGLRRFCGACRLRCLDERSSDEVTVQTPNSRRSNRRPCRQKNQVLRTAVPVRPGKELGKEQCDGCESSSGGGLMRLRSFRRT